MPSLSSSDSDTESIHSDSSKPAIKPKQNSKISSYEEQRLKRIEENRARMEALGIRKIAASIKKTQKKKVGEKNKGKKKMGFDEDDDEYKPSESDEGLSSSGEEDGGDGSKKSKNKSSALKKEAPNKQTFSESDFVDDDDALMQAIALSLQDSAGVLDVSKTCNESSDAHMDEKNREKKVVSSTAEGTGKRKRKQSIKSRVQLTEDELILHFFQFDEAGKGSVSVRDLRRVAVEHDFVWSDEELRDMIHCFDGDGYGKLSLDDFRKIAVRCNMIQGSENAAL